MQTQAIELIRQWRVLLIFAILPALTNCSRIDGAVELNNSEGESYSFEGAKVEAFDLNRAAVVAGGNKTQKGLGSVTDADGTISLQVITATIDDDALYDVEVRCPANNTSDACNVESPLHLVLTGAQLKAGDWTATVLSEIAFQNIAYYAATAYSTNEITQILDNNANALLLALPAGVQKTYENLLTWNAVETDAVKRLDQINTISESLAAGIAGSDLKVLAQETVSAELSSFGIDPGYNVGVELADGYAYLRGEFVPLTIVDIRDLNAISRVATLWESYGGPYTAAGDFLYWVGIADWTFEDVLYVYDISDRQQPHVVGQMELSPSASILKASNGYVYVSIGDALRIIDATDPTSPTVVATLSIEINNLFVVGNRVYVSNATGVHIVDVSTPSTPLVVGTLETPRAASGVTIIGNYAYVTIPGAAADDPVQLQVVDISNPAEPTPITELSLASGTGGVTVFGKRAYADTGTTTQILDISNPAAPLLTDSFSNPSPAGIRLSDAAFLEITRSAVSVVDPSIASQPVVQSASVPLNDVALSNAEIAGSYLYMPNKSDVGSGFKIFDLADPLAPQLLTTFDGAHFLGSMTFAGNYLFAIELAFGAVEVIDISNPLQPEQLNNLRLDANQEELFGIGKFVVTGNTLFAPWNHQANDGGDGIGYGEWGCTNSANPNGDVGGLFAVDVSVPATPAIANHICIPEGATAVATSGSYAYAATGDGALQVVDVTDPTQLTLTSSVNLAAPANSIALVGSYLWVTEGDAGIEIFNISNPAAPVLLTHIAVPGDTTSIDITTNYVYVAAGLSGVHIFDIGNPMLPQLVGSVSTDLAAVKALVFGDYLYATTSAGLEIFKAFPTGL